MLSKLQKANLKISIPLTKKGYENEKFDMVEIYTNITGNTLKKSGKAWIGLCPFHEEDTPSFAIYEDTDSYYCFGCEVSGKSKWLKKKLEEK